MARHRRGRQWVFVFHERITERCLTFTRPIECCQCDYQHSCASHQLLPHELNARSVSVSRLSNSFGWLENAGVSSRAHGLGAVCIRTESLNAASRCVCVRLSLRRSLPLIPILIATDSTIQRTFR